MIDLIHNPGAYGGVFNIGHTTETSILDLAKAVRELTESSSDTILVPYEQAYGRGFEDMSRRYPDITKIHRLIGYRPSLELREMLEQIIAYERAQLEPPAQQ